MAQFTYLTNDDIGEQSMEGYDCFDPNGEKMGDIDGVIVDETNTPRYVVVNAGGLFSSKQYVVPYGEIARVDEGDKKVYFKSLTKDTLKSGSYPEFNDQWWESNDYAAWTGHERQVAAAYQHGHEHEREGRIDYTSDLYTRQPEGTQRLQLMEERLQATKQREQAGQVTLGKRITERQETVNVPLREERVVIERSPGSGQPAPGRELREGETVDVPVMKETAQVEKQPYVREEVGVRKEAVERTEQVQGTVRREELEVKDGQEHIVDTNAAAMDERQRRMRAGEGPQPVETPEEQRARTGNNPPRP
jgi:uncharacterized protein (TIGR02271 family)